MISNMKKFLILLFLVTCSSHIFAEKVTFRTGETFATSLTDYFFPVDRNVTGSRCSVVSIKKIDKDMWCLSIAAWRSGTTSVPVIFDYYVRPGDTITLRRITDPMKECSYKILTINWNEIEIDI